MKNNFYIVSEIISKKLRFVPRFYSIRQKYSISIYLRVPNKRSIKLSFQDFLINDETINNIKNQIKNDRLIN